MGFQTQQEFSEEAAPVPCAWRLASVPPLEVLVSSLSTATFCKPTLVLPGLITDRPPVIGISHASS